MSHPAIYLAPAALLVASVGLLACSPIDATSTRPMPTTAGQMARVIDPEQAIQTEFAGIEKQGTATAYTLFAQRHPHHRLAREAQRRADRLMQGDRAGHSQN